MFEVAFLPTAVLLGGTVLDALSIVTVVFTLLPSATVAQLIRLTVNR